jgi:hypothetical protein
MRTSDRWRSQAANTISSKSGLECNTSAELIHPRVCHPERLSRNGRVEARCVRSPERSRRGLLRQNADITPRFDQSGPKYTAVERSCRACRWSRIAFICVADDLALKLRLMRFAGLVTQREIEERRPRRVHRLRVVQRGNHTAVGIPATSTRLVSRVCTCCFSAVRFL